MSKKQWAWSLAGWLALALLTATQTVVGMRAEGMQHDWSRLFLVVASQWLPWALATPLVLWLGKRRPVRLDMDGRSLMAHAGLCLGIAIALAVWSSLLQITFRPWGVEGSTPPPLWTLATNRLFSSFHVAVLIYAGLLALGRSLESQKQLAEAQLMALRKQLEPHFLFNTLHGIAGMVREGKNDQAVTMIARLSDLLRQVLDGSERQMSPLGEEVEFLEKYLEIQRMRLGDRLQVSIEVGSGLHGHAVPSLILQPLVENAIQHGVSRRREGGRLWIRAKEAGGELVLCVGNDGQGLPKRSEGVGLRNTRDRIRNLYGGGAQFALREIGGGAVEAELRLPLNGAGR